MNVSKPKSVPKCPTLMKRRAPTTTANETGTTTAAMKKYRQGHGSGQEPAGEQSKLDKENMGPSKSKVREKGKVVCTPVKSRLEHLYEEGAIVNSRYLVVALLGSGSFGEVYKCQDCREKGMELALKVEKPGAVTGLLDIERVVYGRLKGGHGVPKMLFYDLDPVMKYKLLGLELLGPSLQEMLIKCGGKFSFNTVAMLADQMIERVEYLHNKNILHRDLKPENFLLGREDAKAINRNPYYWKRVSGEEIYLVDFGLSKQYRNSLDLKHIPQRTYSNLTGTARYTSIHSHCYMEMSRRDDLESLGYIFVYFLKGKLPWQGLAGVNKKEKEQKIKELKIQNTTDVLCQGLPTAISKYMEYSRRLTYEQVPDYQFLRALFRQHINNLKLQGIPLLYDWNNPTNKPSTTLSASTKAKIMALGRVTKPQVQKRHVIKLV